MPTYRVQREPIVTVLAASAAVPATPGAYVWQRKGPVVGPIVFPPEKLEAKLIRILSGDKISMSDTVIVSGSDDAGFATAEITYEAYSNVTWEEKVHIPPRAAIAARDPSTIVTGKLGWDGGGRGRPQVTIGHRAAFQFARVGAIQAGLARPGIDYSFAAPRYAWYRHGNVLAMTAKGLVVATLDADISDAEIAGWVFAIERISGEIRWLYAESTSDPWIVAHTAQDDGGQLVPIGMPYTVGDSIDSLEVLDASGLLVFELPAVRCRMTDTAWSELGTSLPAFTAELVSDPIADLSPTLPPVSARLGEAGWASLVGDLPAVSAELVSEPTFSINLLYASLPPMFTTFYGLVGTLGALALDLPPVLARIEEVPQGRIAGSIGPIRALISDYHRDSGMEFLALGLDYVLDNPLLLIAVDGIELGDTASITVIMDLISADGLTIADNATIGALLDVLIQEGLFVSDGGDLARREALQYAVNLATGAPSVYRGFDFQGFVTVEGTAYGWRSNGLYRLGANLDEADTIRALVDFGISDYGTAQRKRVPSAWIGIRTDGQTYLKVRADNGDQHIYRTVASEDNHKAILAKGVAGRQWSVTLVLEDASFASLDSLEIEIAVLQRRFGGR